MQVRRVPGTALANQSTGEVIYTPPVGEDVLRGELGALSGANTVLVLSTHQKGI